MAGERDFVGAAALLGYHFCGGGAKRAAGSGRSARFRGRVGRAGLPLCVAVADESAGVVGQRGMAGVDAALGYHFVWRWWMNRWEWWVSAVSWVRLRCWATTVCGGGANWAAGEW